MHNRPCLPFLWLGILLHKFEDSNDAVARLASAIESLRSFVSENCLVLGVTIRDENSNIYEWDDSKISYLNLRDLLSDFWLTMASGSRT